MILFLFSCGRIEEYANIIPKCYRNVDFVANRKREKGNDRTPHHVHEVLIYTLESFVPALSLYYYCFVWWRLPCHMFALIITLLSSTITTLTLMKNKFLFLLLLNFHLFVLPLPLRCVFDDEGLRAQT